jgi:TRAP-type C4-dicarboxylate transport system permease small subunit
VLDKFERFNRRLSSWFEWIGIAGILVMMVITCVDVVGAKVFKMPVLGSIDIVMLCQIVAISFACGMTLVVGRHIQVEFFFPFLPRPVQRVVNSVIHLIGLLLFIVIIWRVYMLGHSFQSTGQYSMTVYIPYYPFAYGVAIACIPVCLVLLVKFLKSLTKGVEK